MASASGKSRKVGRGARKKSHIRYKAENRSVKNKERRMEKQAKFEAKKKLKKERRAKEKLKKISEEVIEPISGD